MMKLKKIKKIKKYLMKFNLVGDSYDEVVVYLCNIENVECY